MAHLFVSYAHIDSDFVALLKLEVEKSGFEVWVDNERLRAGEDWRPRRRAGTGADSGSG